MKNQKEIYEALLAGETLIMDKIFKVKLENGELYNPDTFDGAEYSFCFPDRWQIYKKPKWYENIPEDGTANAAFIVRACNNHEKLLSALKELVYATNNPHSDWKTVREQVENAIKAIKQAEDYT